MNFKKYIPKKEETVKIIIVVVIATAIGVIAAGGKLIDNIKRKVA